MKTIRRKIAITTALLSLTLTGCSFSTDISEIPEQAKAAKEALSEAQESFSEAKETISEAQQTVKDVTDTAKDNASTLNSVIEQGKELQEEYASSFGSIQTSNEGLLTSAADLNITPQDDKGKDYTFTYDGKEYSAIHTADHWKILDSYDINNEPDMMIICQTLIDLHPIHGKDMVSFRTADDMVYEWEVHNLGYALVSDDDPMKSHLRHIDFDPRDQGCSFDEIYYNHTGKEFDLGTILGG